MNQLELLTNKNIDRQKWDLCVQHASHPLPYAHSWYLDSVAEHWDGLVWNDYEAVMPLVWLRKFGVTCLYQPYYCQQLGVFGSNLSRDTIGLFLRKATEKFPYIHLQLNPSASLAAVEFGLKERKNLVLNLSLDAESIRKKYSENHRRNIAKAEKAGFMFTEIPLETFQRFYLENINRAQLKFKKQHEKIFYQLTKAVLNQKAGNIYGALNQSEEIVAASMILIQPNRIINIVNVSSELGKKTGAAHFLFNQIIRQHAGQQSLFDFEGSSVSSIARFYEGFGAQTEIFYLYQTHILKRFGDFRGLALPSNT